MIYLLNMVVFCSFPEDTRGLQLPPFFCSGAAGDSLATGMRHDHQLDAFKAWMT
jgi:hypothetical protein